jgi:predicted nuclease with TOPRIM domain
MRLQKDLQRSGLTTNMTKRTDMQKKDEEIAKLLERVEKMKAARDEARKSEAKMSDMVKNLKTKVERLEEASKGLKENQSVDVVDEVREVVKKYIFRTNKLCEDDEDLVVVTKKCLKFITIDHGLSETMFVQTYKGVVSSALSEARNYVQSQGKTAAKGKNIWRLHASLCIYH